MLLQGPVSLSEWKLPGGQYVYVFGDLHAKLGAPCVSSQEKTMSIADFLHDTIAHNKDKTLDIFVEFE
jgi:hypothetical protein